MELSAGDLRFTFQLNSRGTRWVAPIALTEWEPFRSKNTVAGREGQRVLLECPFVYDAKDEAELAERAAYTRSLEYFLNHRAALQHSVIAACATFVQELHAVKVKYEVDASELAQFATPEDLRSMIDLSYVLLFPYQHLGLPYLGLEFVCNWSEDGWLAVLLGTEVAASGYPGSGLAVDRSIREDGGVI